MKAVTCTDTRLEVVELPDPRPAKGQLVLEVERTGICGSDLHARHNCDELADVTAEIGYDGMFRSDRRRRVRARVLRRGARAGSRHPARPARRHQGRVVPAAAPGVRGAPDRPVAARAGRLRRAGAGRGLADLRRPQRPARAGRRADRADGRRAARGAPQRDPARAGRRRHRLRAGRAGRDQHAQGHRRAHRDRQRLLRPDAGRWPPPAAPTSSSTRGPTRRTPRPRARPPRHRAGGVRARRSKSMEKLRRIPIVPWERVWQAAGLVGATTPKHPVIFECVGVPGMIDQVITSAPLYSRVVVVGRVHGTRRDPPGDGDQQGDRPALRARLHAAGVPRLAAPARRRQGRRGARWSPASSAWAGWPPRSPPWPIPSRHAKILIDPRSEAVTPD